MDASTPALRDAAEANQLEPVRSFIAEDDHVLDPATLSSRHPLNSPYAATAALLASVRPERRLHDE